MPLKIIGALGIITHAPTNSARIVGIDAVITSSYEESTAPWSWTAAAIFSGRTVLLMLGPQIG